MTRIRWIAVASSVFCVSAACVITGSASSSSDFESQRTDSKNLDAPIHAFRLKGFHGSLKDQQELPSSYDAVRKEVEARADFVRELDGLFWSTRTGAKWAGLTYDRRLSSHDSDWVWDGLVGSRFPRGVSIHGRASGFRWTGMTNSVVRVQSDPDRWQDAGPDLRPYETMVSLALGPEAAFGRYGIRDREGRIRRSSERLEDGTTILRYEFHPTGDGMRQNLVASFPADTSCASRIMLDRWTSNGEQQFFIWMEIEQVDPVDYRVEFPFKPEELLEVYSPLVRDMASTHFIDLTGMGKWSRGLVEYENAPDRDADEESPVASIVQLVIGCWLYFGVLHWLWQQSAEKRSAKE